MLIQILQGLIVVLIGLFLVVFSRQLIDFFGRITWIEVHLGPAQSYTVMKALGLLIMVIGVLWAGGTMQILIIKLVKFVRFLMGIE